MLMFNLFSLNQIKYGGVSMVTALNVANNILTRAFRDEIDITPMKLQKIIYFVYREYYKRTKRGLFNERFEVWRYGPVLPSIYSEFKQNGSNTIKRYIHDENGSVIRVKEKVNSQFKCVVDFIWDKYKNYDGIYLSSLTHRDGTAWRKAREKGEYYLLDEDIEKDEVYE